MATITPRYGHYLIEEIGLVYRVVEDTLVVAHADHWELETAWRRVADELWDSEFGDIVTAREMKEAVPEPVSPPRPQITATGRGSERFEYFACYGSESSPGETGWVLVLTGTGKILAPQALSAKEVVEDLEAMGALGSADARGSVSLFTEQMIAALEAGQVHERRHEDEPDAETRLEQLRRELAAIQDL